MNLKFLFADAETMSLRENAIILDMSFLFVDFNGGLNYTVDELKDMAVRFKFDVQEQKNRGRHVSQQTLEFWKEQSKEVRERCVLPSENDISIYELPEKVIEYLHLNDVYSNKDFFFITRGTLDEKLMSYLYDEMEIHENQKFYRYNMHRDVRTALHFSVGAEGGWFKMDEFDQLDKHDSRHDCVMDVLMIQKALGLSL